MLHHLANALKVLPIAAIVLVGSLDSGWTQGKQEKPELRLETQGIFWAGGEIVNRSQPGAENNTILRNQVFVEYFIPKKLRKNAPPIVFTHTDLSGVVFRTTPDGREGWAEYFVRRGYPVFVMDPPGNGRAGFDVDEINQLARGQLPPAAVNPINRSDSSAWARWNIGPSLGVLGDGIVQGNQMATSDDAIRHFLGALIPRQRMTREIAEPSFMAAIEKIEEMAGRVMFVGWSLSGGMGQRLVIERPDLFSALAVFESTECPPNPPDAIVEALVSNRLPFLSINGAAGHSSNTGRSKEVCQPLVDMLQARGANATNVFLPDIGIPGNSHMMMWERNSDEIAQVLLNWIEEKVVDK